MLRKICSIILLLVSISMSVFAETDLPPTDAAYVFQIGNPSYLKYNEPAQIDVDNAEVVPFIDEASGRTMLPLRCLAENLGFAVEWVEAENKIFIQKNSILIELTVQENKSFIRLLKSIRPYPIDTPISSYSDFLYSSEYELDAAPQVISDRTFVPLRFIAEMFEYDTIWNVAEQKIYLTQTDIDKIAAITPEVRQEEGVYQIGIVVENFSKIPLCMTFNSGPIRIAVYDRAGKEIPIAQAGPAVVTYGFVPGEESTFLCVNVLQEKFTPGTYRAEIVLGGYLYTYRTIPNLDTYTVDFEVH